LRWKNCTIAWKWHYEGLKGVLKGQPWFLKLCIHHDLWIWHSFFSLPDSLNDINVLQHLHSFKGSLQAQHRRWSSRWMVTSITWDTILFFLGVGYYTVFFRGRILSFFF
jgi:hypothetical protein